mmetsp:Transcript_1419/g.3188  ORF Transcript_1419/g.3188 Transcript_1419/m.3188 type:complete len:313 (-) Transcript_1419:474-1412(-)
MAMVERTDSEPLPPPPLRSPTPDISGLLHLQPIVGSSEPEEAPTPVGSSAPAELVSMSPEPPEFPGTLNQPSSMRRDPFERNLKQLEVYDSPVRDSAKISVGVDSPADSPCEHEHPAEGVEAGVAFAESVDPPTISYREHREGLIQYLQELSKTDPTFMFTTNQLKEFRSKFSVFDSDQSGSVSTDELIYVFQAIGAEVDEDEIDEMVALIDADHNGVIEYNEFLMLMAQKMLLSEADENEQQLQEAFKVIDRDKDGLITYRELEEAVSTILDEADMSEEQLTVMIEEADVHGKGAIDFEDFCRILSCKPWP